MKPKGKPLWAKALVGKGVGGRVAVGVGRGPGPGQRVGVTMTVATTTCVAGSATGAARESAPVKK